MSSPTLLLRHAIIRPGPWVDAAPEEPVWVLLRGGRIVAVGREGEPEPTDTAEAVDLDGAVLLPGLVDAHTHLAWSAEDRWTVNWPDVGSSLEALEVLDQVAARVTPGDWVTGGAWSRDRLRDDDLPRARDLDEVSSDHPVFLVSADHDVALANTQALRLAAVYADSPDPAGGVIERDPTTGEPTGLLRGQAVRSRLVAGVVPERDRHRVDAELRDLLADLAGRGVTEVHDIGTVPERSRPPFRRERSFTDAEVVKQLDRDLTLRYLYRPSLLRAEELVATPPEDTELVRMVGFKMSIDNGWYSAGDTNRLASFRWPGFDEALRLGRVADRAGLTVSLHTMGDLGVTEGLDLLSGLTPRRVGVEALHRIIHARRMSPDDVQRCAELGVAIEVQPWEVVSSGPRLTGLGDEKWQAGIAPFRDLVDADAALVIGSDRRLGLRADEVDTDPLTGVEIAVTRAWGGSGPWQPDQALTVTQALAASTTTPARVAGAGRDRGRIAAGYQADLVALSDDPWRVVPDRISTCRPVLTISAGRIVYGPGNPVGD